VQPTRKTGVNFDFLDHQFIFEFLSDEHIRHVPVFDEKVVGMISVGDVVRAIVDQQHQEVKLLKKYITGDYY
jgi:CBS domain-containing protein